MPAASYKSLAFDERHLKGIGNAAATPAEGVTLGDLLEAERMAQNKINSWLLAVCGGVRGAELAGVYTAATEAEIDPEIADLADLIASSIVWGWYQRRNSANIARSDAPVSMEDSLMDQAIAKGEQIRASGKILKADGTLRRLKFAAREQGPVGGGPMYGKTHFPQPSWMTPEDL